MPLSMLYHRRKSVGGAKAALKSRSANNSSAVLPLEAKSCTSMRASARSNTLAIVNCDAEGAGGVNRWRAGHGAGRGGERNVAGAADVPPPFTRAAAALVGAHCASPHRPSRATTC